MWHQLCRGCGMGCAACAACGVYKEGAFCAIVPLCHYAIKPKAPPKEASHVLAQRQGGGLCGVYFATPLCHCAIRGQGFYNLALCITQDTNYKGSIGKGHSVGL